MTDSNHNHNHNHNPQPQQVQPQQAQPQQAQPQQTQPQPQAQDYSPQAAPSSSRAPSAAHQQTAELMAQIHAQVSRVFLAQDVVITQSLAALLAGGHLLLEGKPGLGKTHLVLTLARCFGGEFSRIQFTPDLMPSDVTGFSLYDMSASQFVLRKGPVFTNLLLADEINRAPAKTQASLLEVMQEAQVTIDGTRHVLNPPFMCFATQNPIEHEGTYPLPEAQLDRFVMKAIIDYPEANNEAEIIARATAPKGHNLSSNSLQAICTPEDILHAQEQTAAIQVVDEVTHYIIALVRATRETHHLSLGAGTRGGIDLLRIAKAYALLSGRDFVIPNDVKHAAIPVLRHRIQLSPELAISGQTEEAVLTQIIEEVPAPRT